jgi:hypothetical protein
MHLVNIFCAFTINQSASKFKDTVKNNAHMVSNNAQMVMGLKVIYLGWCWTYNKDHHQTRSAVQSYIHIHFSHVITVTGQTILRNMEDNKL